MNKRTTLVAASVVVLCAVGLLFTFWHKERTEAGPSGLLGNPISSADPVDPEIGTVEESDGLSEIDTTRVALPPSRNPATEAGLDPEALVTWEGKVLDHWDNPMKGIEIRLTPLPDEGDSNRDGKGVLGRTGDGGSFAIPRLETGTYSVEVFICDQPKIGFFEWGEVSFNTPGLQERDIVLPGKASLIGGVVIDDATGLPLKREADEDQKPKEGDRYNQVVVSVQDSRSGEFQVSVQVDPQEGTFCFMGLPDGIYHVYLTGPGFNIATIAGVKAEENHINDDLCFHVPPMGTLKLFLKGFEERTFDHTGRDPILFKFTPSKSRFAERGVEIFQRETSFPMEQGRKTVTIGNKKMGMVTRKVEIFPGEVTELGIHAGEFNVTGSDTITVTGRLLKADGSPLPHAFIEFSNHKGKKVVSEATDQDGRFTLTEIAPGLWSARCIAASSGEPFALTPDSRPEGDVSAISLGEIVIPDSADDSYSLELKLPSGGVSGILCDKSTGLTIKDSTPQTLFYLYHSDGNKRAGTFMNGGGSCFSLEGIPRGEYFIVVDAPGYKLYSSQPFQLKEGQSLDLGSLLLDPTGIIELDAVNPEGERIKAQVRCDVEQGEENAVRRRKMPDGKYLCWPLPAGRVTITVDAYLFKEKKITIDLVSGEILPVRVVLDRE